MINSKSIFTILAVLFFQVFLSSLVFADFTICLEGIKSSQDIIQAQGAGFNSVTVSPEAPSIKTLSDQVIKSGLSISVPNSQYVKINLFSDKKQIAKREDLRFVSYNAIIEGASGLVYNQCYLEGKPLYEYSSKSWENIVDVISEISFVAEILNRGNKIENPVEIKAPLKAASYEYGGIKYTFLVNPTEKRQQIPSMFYQQMYDVVGEKSPVLKKNARNSKNNFKPFKALVFRYE